MSSSAGAARTAALTAGALVAFAANSLLCRLALRAGTIDAASFTMVRIGSGALTLAVLAAVLRRDLRESRTSSWWPALLLFAYAMAFSLAYVDLTAGTGALILFGSVQLTMLGAARIAGERLRAVQRVGIGVACAGLVALVAPGVAAPPPGAAALMAMAGIAWGLYSLRGRGAADPLAATARNFIFAVPFAAAAGAMGVGRMHIEAQGVALAVASGSLASGLGYVAWYAALRGLTASGAAIVQLAVPVLAALAGVALLGEALTLPLVVGGIAVLGGIGLALRGAAPR